MRPCLLAPMVWEPLLVCTTAAAWTRTAACTTASSKLQHTLAKNGRVMKRSGCRRQRTGDRWLLLREQRPRLRWSYRPGQPHQAEAARRHHAWVSLLLGAASADHRDWSCHMQQIAKSFGALNLLDREIWFFRFFFSHGQGWFLTVFNIPMGWVQTDRNC